MGFWRLDRVLVWLLDGWRTYPQPQFLGSKRKYRADGWGYRSKR